jgi:hypothetical protein
MSSEAPLPHLVHPSSKRKPSEKQKLSIGLTPFGRHAPRFTIASGHTEIWHPLDTPSPDAYTLPDASTPRVHGIQGGPSAWPRHPTADVDLFDERVFQWRRPITTDPRPGSPAPVVRDGLGPDFNPPTALTPRSIRIKSYFPPLRCQTVTPGPAAYNVNDGHRSITYSIRIPKPRDEWLYRDLPYSQQPWRYSPDTSPCTPRDPAWTIGGRSRRRRPLGKSVGLPKQKTIVVGCVCVNVNEDDYEYAVRHIQDDIELKKMFMSAIGVILARKPLTPLGVLRESFIAFRRAMLPFAR